MATTADAGVLEVATLNVRAGQAAAFEAAFAGAAPHRRRPRLSRA